MSGELKSTLKTTESSNKSSQYCFSNYPFHLLSELTHTLVTIHLQLLFLTRVTTPFTVHWQLLRESSFHHVLLYLGRKNLSNNCLKTGTLNGLRRCTHEKWKKKFLYNTNGLFKTSEGGGARIKEIMYCLDEQPNSQDGYIKNDVGIVRRIRISSVR